MNNKKDLTKIFEKIFKEEIFNNNLNSFYLACYVAIIAVPSFCLVDYFMYPAQYKEIGFIRLMVTVLNIIILIAARNIRMLQKYSIQLGFLVIFFCALGISIMIHITEGYQSPYYAGLVLANLVLCTFLIVPMRITIILSSIIYALYIIPILFKGNIEYISVFVNNNIFLISMMIFAVLGARSREELRFNEFSARYNIQKANEDLENLTEELAETNQKLLTHDRLKTEFFTNVSHELRTPLTLILAPLKPLIEGITGPLPQAVTETLLVMQNNGHRLLKQINNLLDFSKLEAGKMRLDIEEVDLIAFCKDIIAAMQHAATNRGLKLYFQYQMGDAIKVMIDSEQFEKVVMNLLAPSAPVGGSALADQLLYYTNGVLPGVYRVLMFSFSNSPLTNGVLVYVPFAITSNAPDHDEVLSLSNVVLSSPQGIAVPANASGGVLAITQPPRFISIAGTSGGSVHLELLGASNRTYVIQTATNLPAPQWITLQTNVATNGVLDFDETSSSSVPLRFFRAMVVP